MFQMFFFFFLSLFPTLKRFEGLEKIMVISLDLFVIFCHIFHSAYVFASRKELSNYLDTHTHTNMYVYIDKNVRTISRDPRIIFKQS